jgi:hypothetical protein
MGKAIGKYNIKAFVAFNISTVVLLVMTIIMLVAGLATELK